MIATVADRSVANFILVRHQLDKPIISHFVTMLSDMTELVAYPLESIVITSAKIDYGDGFQILANGRIVSLEERKIRLAIGQCIQQINTYLSGEISRQIRDLSRNSKFKIWDYQLKQRLDFFRFLRKSTRTFSCEASFLWRKTFWAEVEFKATALAKELIDYLNSLQRLHWPYQLLFEYPSGRQRKSALFSGEIENQKFSKLTIQLDCENGMHKDVAVNGKIVELINDLCYQALWELDQGLALRSFRPSPAYQGSVLFDWHRQIIRLCIPLDAEYRCEGCEDSLEII